MTDPRPGVVDETARRAFEVAWRVGRPTLRDFLPPESSPDYLPTLEELVAIDAELVARSGRAPAPDDYLAEFPALSHPDALRRLEVALDEARRAARSLPHAGRTLGPYTLVEEHARGGFGAVWRARDPRLRRDVAVKVLHRPDDPQARVRFEGEARLAAGLQHPGIVPVHDIGGLDAEVPFFVMKLLTGRTLAEVVAALHSGPAPDRVAERRALEAVLAAARATEFAHSRGVIHRDLKPSNVLVGDFGETVVLDWGIGRRLETAAADPAASTEGDVVPAHAGSAEVALTLEGSVSGTPAYMSPEQASGQRLETDARSDVYALGAILFEVVTGRAARVGGSQTELVAAAASQREAPPPSARAARRGVPKALDAICAKAMAPVPAHRYPDAGGFAADLERYLADEPVSVLPDGLAARVGRSMRRHRTAWATGAVASALLVALAVVAGFSWQRAERVREVARVQRLGELQQRAAQAEASARAATAQGRYADGTALLEPVLVGLAAEPSLEALASRLGGLHAVLTRLATFDRRGDDARFLNGEERYVESLRAARDALTALGLDADDAWTQLPLAHLPSDRQQDVLAAAHHLLLLSASSLVSRVIAQGTPQAAAALCPEALVAVRRAAAHEPSVYGRLIHAACGAFGAADGAPPAAPPGPTAADAFFVGLLHLWLDQFPGSAVAQLGPVLTAAAPGVDLVHPRDTALRLLKDAVRLAPRDYWAPFLLGWALRATGDHRAAELAFGLSLSLKPDYPRALEGRGGAILADALASGAPERVSVALADYDRALSLAPADPWTYWSRAHALDLLERPADAAAARRRAFSLDAAALYRAIRSAPTEELSANQGPEQALRVAEERLAAHSAEADAVELAAAAELCLGRDAAAATRLAGLGTRSGFAHLLAGIVALRAGRAEEALRAFDAARGGGAPALFLASLGSAMAAQQLGRPTEPAAREALARAEAPWQREAALGLVESK